MVEVAALVRALPAGTISGWLLVSIVLLGLIKAWPVLKRLRVEEDGSLRGDLLQRIRALEEAMAEERRLCLHELAEMRRDYEGRLSAQSLQIDGLQRELYNLRLASMTHVSRIATPGEMADRARKLDEGKSE
ncbi:hypothetical protein ACWPMX_07725 [Tsuneonella sp. HG094]